MSLPSTPHYGIVLPDGSQIVHGAGAKIKDPFTNIPVTLHELSPGSVESGPAFKGQSGFIQFDTSTRLPRHVHISGSTDGDEGQHLIHERIFVVGGVALVELSGQIYVIPPMSLVTIAPGAPHTWTACPEGVNITEITGLRAKSGENLVSSGKFLMLYEYEEITGFFPTAQSKRLNSVRDYIRCDDLESIRIPQMSAGQVLQRCHFVKDTEIIVPK